MVAQHSFQLALGIGNPAFLKILRRFQINGIRRLRESKTCRPIKKEDGTERRPPKGPTAI
jgi:hypothetical protein